MEIEFGGTIRLPSLKLPFLHLKIGRNWPLKETRKSSNHHFSGAKMLVSGSVFIHLGGGNSNIFGIFTPIPGEMIQFDEHIIQVC